MPLLLSNYKPAQFDNVKSAKKVFEEYLPKSELVRIATGYISADSLIELKNTIEINKGPKINLMIGMHYLDGFTQKQLSATIELNNFLSDNNLGFVSLSDSIRFHGKLYSFTHNNNIEACIIGSSNLSSLLGKERLYESDFLILEKNIAKDIDLHIHNLISKLGTKITNFATTDFKIIEEPPLLENHEGVTKLSMDELSKTWLKRGAVSFEIKIKAEAKSHLNTFFGKGRLYAKGGYILSRPWYEANIMVSNQITSLPEYPRNTEFSVVTDDGWQFDCVTNGDYSKNFRSKNDLTVLGKWLKGRLENSGALKFGEPVTEDILNKYGRQTMTLISTDNPKLWLLDFKV